MVSHPRHTGSESCVTCQALEKKIMDTATWYLIHQGHGEIGEQPLEGAPAGYEIHWLVCPCGARLATEATVTSCRRR